MSDFADLASDREELDRQLALRAAALHADNLVAGGQCHNCDASIPPGHRFCDADCRDDWQRRLLAEKQRP